MSMQPVSYRIDEKTEENSKNTDDFFYCISGLKVVS